MQGPGAGERPMRAAIAAEALERLAFHGTCAILVLYLNEHLLWSERDARGIFHLFLAGAYLAPLAGRAVAGRLGRRRTARWASWLHLAGLALLAAIESRAGLASGLLLVAAGAGGAAPATAALAGERPGGDGAGAARTGATLRRAVRAASLAAKLGTPLLLALAGPRAAFAGAAIALAAGFLVARADRAPEADAPLAPERHGFLRVIATAVSRLGTGQPGQDWLAVARDVHPAEAVEGARAVLRLFPVFAALALSWALLDQRASAWVFQARQLDLSLGPVTLSPAQLQALSPGLALLLAPFARGVLLPALDRRGIALPPPWRVGAGLLATAAAFAAAGVLEGLVARGHVPHGLWQLPQHLLVTGGEALVAVTALELASAQAPRAMRGAVTSIGLVTAAAGNLLVAAVGKLFWLEGPAWFWAFAALGVVAALAFRAVTRAWRPAAADAPAAGSR